jgi:hypothetical protein
MAGTAPQIRYRKPTGEWNLIVPRSRIRQTPRPNRVLGRIVARLRRSRETGEELNVTRDDARFADLSDRVSTLIRGSLRAHVRKVEHLVRGKFLGAKVEVAIHTIDGSIRVTARGADPRGSLDLAVTAGRGPWKELAPQVFVLTSRKASRTWSALSEILHRDLTRLVGETQGTLRWASGHIEFSLPPNSAVCDNALRTISRTVELLSIMAISSVPEPVEAC